MIHYKLHIFLLGSFLLFLGCTDSDKNTEKSELLYKNYRSLVTEVEKDTVITEKDLGEQWKSRTDTLKQSFANYKTEAALHMDQYEAERREEVNAFDDRLEVAFETRQKKYNDVSYRYTLRKEMLNLDVAEDDMSRIDTSNIAATYQHFVNKVKSNHTNYTPKDWQLIEGWWSALQNRKQAISSMIQPTDQELIAKQQEAYRKLREQIAKAATAPSE